MTVPARKEASINIQATPHPAATRTPFRLTTHAAVRLQQRGIPPWFVQLLLEHGDGEHDGHGAVIKTVTKATRQRLARVLDRKEYARAERWFGVYAVVLPDSAVVTAAHRTQRRHH